ncbi:hypothetical protein PR048_000754 [Dryococelus australis]|uniref:Uncharacterized protein n=1 Tax=Dryococelus australis TaxID=614101 RepID=A0ABQ9IFI8_9NEOP|nr:hypothetical protein PR048_000754 [Dryococelus australis]
MLPKGFYGIEDDRVEHKKKLSDECFRAASTGLLVCPYGAEVGVVVRTLASYNSEPGSIPGGTTPAFGNRVLVKDDTAGRRILSTMSRFPSPCNSGAAPYSPYITLIGSQVHCCSEPPKYLHSTMPFSDLHTTPSTTISTTPSTTISTTHSTTLSTTPSTIINTNLSTTTSTTPSTKISTTLTIPPNTSPSTIISTTFSTTPSTTISTTTSTTPTPRVHGGLVVSLLASHQGGFNPRPGHSRFSYVCWSTGFIRDLLFHPPFCFGVAPYPPKSTSSALKTSIRIPEESSILETDNAIPVSDEEDQWFKQRENTTPRRKMNEHPTRGMKLSSGQPDGLKAVAERLACSSLAQGNRVQSPVGPLPHVGRIVPDDAAGRRAFTWPSRFLHRPIPALLHTHLNILVGSQDLAVRNYWNSCDHTETLKNARHRRPRGCVSAGGGGDEHAGPIGGKSRTASESRKEGRGRGRGSGDVRGMAARALKKTLALHDEGPSSHKVLQACCFTSPAALLPAVASLGSSAGANTRRTRCFTCRAHTTNERTITRDVTRGKAAERLYFCPVQMGRAYLPLRQLRLTGSGCDGVVGIWPGTASSNGYHCATGLRGLSSISSQ